MDGGGVGETMGIALAAVGVLLGKKYGANAERKFNRILGRVALAAVAMAVALVLIYWAVASAG
jgi:Na+-driven multidrug efflux pump